MAHLGGSPRQAAIEKAAGEFMTLCTKQKDFIGLSLMSNQAKCSYRSADDLSDLDLVLYVSIPQVMQINATSARDLFDQVQIWLPDWLPNFDFMAPVLGGIEVNVYQRIVEYDERPETRWSEPLREAYASGFDALYDPAGRIGRLIADKLRWYTGEREAKIAYRLARASWDADASKKQAARGLLFSAHSLINASIDNLLYGICYLESVFPPSRKWLWDRVRSLKVFSGDDIEALNAAIVTRDLSSADVLRRLDVLLPRLDRFYSAGRAAIGMDPGDFYNSRVSINRQLTHFSADDDANWGYESLARGRASWYLIGRRSETSCKPREAL